MTKYLISFPASAMNVPTEDLTAVGEAAREVIREAKVAGVYVFAGGINDAVAPVMVASDGTVANETYPQTKLAKACRCSRVLREFGDDPES